MSVRDDPKVDEMARIFWEPDLSDVERAFLGGKDPLKLEPVLMAVVPPQGSVLLDRTIHLDELVSHSTDERSHTRS